MAKEAANSNANLGQPVNYFPHKWEEGGKPAYAGISQGTGSTIDITVVDGAHVRVVEQVQHKSLWDEKSDKPYWDHIPA